MHLTCFLACLPTGRNLCIFRGHNHLCCLIISDGHSSARFIAPGTISANGDGRPTTILVTDIKCSLLLLALIHRASLLLAESMSLYCTLLRLLRDKSFFVLSALHPTMHKPHSCRSAFVCGTTCMHVPNLSSLVHIL